MSKGPLVSREVALAKAQDIFDCFEEFHLVGSLRRGKSDVHDVDVLVFGNPRDAVAVAQPLRCGSKRGTFLVNDLQVDVISIPTPRSLGAMLLHFTGSKEHNIMMRGLAMNRGWKLNEYGLWDKNTGEQLPFSSEQEIFQALDMNFVEPALREISDDVAVLPCGIAQ